jgi:sugar/nucleoside kinase (ribokinase family)
VGLCTLDVVHEVARLPTANEKVTALSQTVAAGGPATNAAVTFAALGGRATLVSAAGRGPAAEVVRADLAAHGVVLVDAAPHLTDAVPVSAVAVLSATGERCVISVDAALTTVDEDPGLAQLVSGVEVVLADGHHAALAAATARVLTDSSVPLLIDAGRWKPAHAALLPRADTVICSAEFRVPGTADPAESAAALLADHVPTVAVSAGAEPVRWWSGARAGSVRPPAVETADTSGAGDALHGAYAYAIAAAPASTVEQRLRFAVEVASLKCRFPGTRTWLAELAERADGLIAELLGNGQPSRA